SSPTATSLAASPNPVAVGQPVTLTATVVPSSAGTVPTGTVTFMDGSAALNPDGTTLDGTGMARFQTSILTAGGHTFTAVYSGSDEYAGGTSLPITEIVTPLLNPTSLQWNDNIGGVDFTYAITGGDLPIGTNVELFWSKTPQFADRIGGPISAGTETVAV